MGCSEERASGWLESGRVTCETVHKLVKNFAAADQDYGKVTPLGFRV